MVKHIAVVSTDVKRLLYFMLLHFLKCYFIFGLLPLLLAVIAQRGQEMLGGMILENDERQTRQHSLAR